MTFAVKHSGFCHSALYDLRPCGKSLDHGKTLRRLAAVRRNIGKIAFGGAFAILLIRAVSGIHGHFLEARKMQTEGIKEQARRLLENLPDSATWEDLIYQIYVRQAVEAGIRDSDQGKTVDVKEVRRRFGLPE